MPGAVAGACQPSRWIVTETALLGLVLALIQCVSFEKEPTVEINFLNTMLAACLTLSWPKIAKSRYSFMLKINFCLEGNIFS